MANFSLPSHYRTWQFQKNQAVAVQATVALTNARGLRLIKNSMIGSGSWTDSSGAGVASSGNWSVVSCSDGVNAGNNDNTDLWNSDLSITWANAGSNHSWIVLKQTGITGTYYLLLDCSTSSSTELVHVKWSKNIFTGGTITNAPTSTGMAWMQAYPLSSSRQWGGPVTNVASVLHVMKSSDGKATRVIMSRNGFSQSLWVIDELEFAPAGDLYPACACIFGSQTAAPTSSSIVIGNYNGGNSITLVQRNGAYPGAAWMHALYTSSTSLIATPTVASDMGSGSWPIYRVGLFSRFDAPGYFNGTDWNTPALYNRGYCGVIRDLWWCQTTGLNEGDFAPSGGGRTHVILGDMVLPNDTGTITLA